MSAVTITRTYDESLASSDSDDYHKILYSSSSHDRSSVGSIPWAEDAIKQNQLEWERIERMFFGEEALPDNDPELRREIVEWTTAFPHLRVVGKKFEFLESEEENSDHTVEDDQKSSANNFNGSFIIHPEAKSIFMDMDLSRLLEKDLRINSVPMISRRRQFTDLNNIQSNGIAWSSKSISRSLEQPGLSSGQSVRRQIFPSNSSNAITSLGISTIPTAPKTLTTTSKSARIVRMPPIMNLILPSQSKYLATGSPAAHFIFSAKNSSVAKGSRRSCTRVQDPIVLPILKLNRREFISEDRANRSISAAANDRGLRAIYLSNSASKLKTSK